MKIREFKYKDNPDWVCTELECEKTHTKIQRHKHIKDEFVGHLLIKDDYNEEIGVETFEIIKELLT